ncbi:MAG TPA: alpha/beta fold hydrolase [Candidatus Gastranaerophilales bacterium]|nr:alpha/beta fold hydrolase [Candidatus Gastranaerophilales bacterium]
MKKRYGKIIIAALGLITGFHVFMCSILFGGIETKLIYYPMDTEIKNIWINIDKKVENMYFYSRDGIKLNGWYVKAEHKKPTIIYCHGQGENISLWQNVIKFLADKGYGIFLVEYRGHGKSSGKPFESGLYIDLESSVNYLKTNEKISENNIILWGRSLGGAVVTDVASRNDFKAIILESSFTNIRDEALHLTATGVLENKLGFWRNVSSLSVKIMPMTQKFESDKKIHKIKSPLLIGHSIHDTTVPVEMSYQLKTLNNSAKLFISDRGSHHESEWFFPEVIKFIESLEKPVIESL